MGAACHTFGSNESPKQSAVMEPRLDVPAHADLDRRRWRHRAGREIALRGCGPTTGRVCTNARRTCSSPWPWCWRSTSTTCSSIRARASATLVVSARRYSRRSSCWCSRPTSRASKMCERERERERGRRTATAGAPITGDRCSCTPTRHASSSARTRCGAAGGSGTRAACARAISPPSRIFLGELYGLPRCDLQTWFDEVQIQHSPRYAYGEAVAVSDEQEAISDRLSLAHSYSRFTRALTTTASAWQLDRESDTRMTMRICARKPDSRKWSWTAVAAAAAVVASPLGETDALIESSAGARCSSRSSCSPVPGRHSVERPRTGRCGASYEGDGYRLSTRGVGRATRLVERLDEIVTDAYKNWKVTGPFSGLAPPPRPPGGMYSSACRPEAE
jgi:hypothetical protein